MTPEEMDREIYRIRTAFKDALICCELEILNAPWEEEDEHA